MSTINTQLPAISLHTRVLGGLPVYVEAIATFGYDGDYDIERAKIYWNKPNSKRATVIENKMTDDDWAQIAEQLLDRLHGI